MFVSISICKFFVVNKYPFETACVIFSGAPHVCTLSVGIKFMRAIVKKYLEKPDPKVFEKLTSEEQRFVEREKKSEKKSSKSK